VVGCSQWEKFYDVQDKEQFENPDCQPSNGKKLETDGIPTKDKIYPLVDENRKKELTFSG